MKLHKDFFLSIGVHTEIKYRTEKTKYGKELVAYEDNKYYPKMIVDKDEMIVCSADEINEFLELLGAFVANQLDTDKTYGFSYKDGSGGFFSKVVRKSGKSYLRVEVVNSNTYYLEKYDCRVINANAKQILSKCTLQEFLPIY